MNLITLSNDQLLLVKATLQKLKDDLISDMNTGGQWSEVTAEVVNDRYNVIVGILKELEDCQTPKVVKRQTLQQTPSKQPSQDKLTTEKSLAAEGWYSVRKAARKLRVDSKLLYNRKDTGKFEQGVHWRLVDGHYFWNVEAIRIFENSH